MRERARERERDKDIKRGEMEIATGTDRSTDKHLVVGFHSPESQTDRETTTAAF